MVGMSLSLVGDGNNAPSSISIVIIEKMPKKKQFMKKIYIQIDVWDYGGKRVGKKMAHPNQWYVPNDGECKELELVLHHRGLIYCQ